MTKDAVNFQSRNSVYDCLETALSRLFPPSCRLCGAAGSGRFDLCRGCLEALPRVGRGCYQCALPLPAGGVYCGACLRRSPAFDRVHAALLYAPPVDTLVQALKFHRQLAAARLLGELLAQNLLARPQPRPELLLPIPLHPRRLRQRGFNQALELARPLSRRLGIPLRPDIAARARHTSAQSELPAADRARNVRGAFALQVKRVPRHVAIVDDVMTTGNTVNELARVLRRAGARRVEVWVAARAL